MCCLALNCSRSKVACARTATVIGRKDVQGRSLHVLACTHVLCAFLFVSCPSSAHWHALASCDTLACAHACVHQLPNCLTNCPTAAPQFITGTHSCDTRVLCISTCYSYTVSWRVPKKQGLPEGHRQCEVPIKLFRKALPAHRTHHAAACRDSRSVAPNR